MKPDIELLTHNIAINTMKDMRKSYEKNINEIIDVLNIKNDEVLIELIKNKSNKKLKGKIKSFYNLVNKNQGNKRKG